MFKLVFGSVTLFAQENELMLKVNITSMNTHVHVSDLGPSTWVHVHVHVLQHSQVHNLSACAYVHLEIVSASACV